MTLTELLTIHRNLHEPEDFGPHGHTNGYDDGLVGTLMLSCPRAGCPVTTLTLAVDERLVSHNTGILVPSTLPCPVCGGPLAPHGFENRR